MNMFVSPTLAAAVASDAATLTLIAILTCIFLLIHKEIASALDGPAARRLNRALSIALAPLGTIFVSVAALRLIETLR